MSRKLESSTIFHLLLIYEQPMCTQLYLLIYMILGGLMQNKFKIKWNFEDLIPANVLRETPLPIENEVETGIENGIEMQPLGTNHAGSNSSIESEKGHEKRTKKEPEKELEYLAMLEDYHKDLFDHPILSSMIWHKWKKVKTFFWLFSGIKIFQHLFGIAFILMTYGGPNLSPGEINGYDIDKICKIIFIVGYSLNSLRILVILGALIRGKSESESESGFRYDIFFKICILLSIQILKDIFYLWYTPEYRELSTL